MYRITGEIEGLADILFNSWTERARRQLAGESIPPLSIEGERLEAANRLPRNGHGVIIPATNFKKAWIAGARLGNVRERRRAIWPLLEATLFVEADLELGRDTYDYLDERIARTKTGTAIVVIRPAVRMPWKTSFAATVTDERRNQDSLRRALEEAGLLNGIGSHRPLYGRFLVKAWEVVR